MLLQNTLFHIDKLVILSIVDINQGWQQQNAIYLDKNTRNKSNINIIP